MDKRWKKIPNKYYSVRDFNGIPLFLKKSMRVIKRSFHYQVSLLRLKREGSISPIKIYIFTFDPQYYKFTTNYFRRPKFIRNFAQRNAIFSSNASFFDKHGKILGLVISRGRTIVPASQNVDNYFLLYKNKISPVIGRFNRSRIRNVEEGVRGYPLIMNDGLATHSLFHNTRRNNKISRRTVIAKHLNGWVSFIVTDTIIAGLSLRELPVVLGGIGIRDALNLDGGGSSQCLLKIDNYKLEISGRDRIPVSISVVPRN